MHTVHRVRLLPGDGASGVTEGLWEDNLIPVRIILCQRVFDMILFRNTPHLVIY